MKQELDGDARAFLECATHNARLIVKDLERTHEVDHIASNEENMG